MTNDPFDERSTAGSFSGHRSQRWPSGRVAAVVALVVLVVGAVGLAIFINKGDDNDPGRVAVNGPGGDDATGFYTPSALPDGWEVTALDVASDDGGGDGAGILGCPCSVTEFDQDGTNGYIAVTSSADRETLARSDADRDPLDDLDGWYEESGRSRVVVWTAPEGSRAIVSEALDQETLEGLAADWTEEEPPMADGYRVRGARSFDHRIDEIPRVGWTIANADTGSQIRISLEPTVVAMSAFASSTVTLPGNALPVGIMGDDSGGRPIVGSWPGDALVTVRAFGPIVDDDSTSPVPPPIEDDTVQMILGSFQPVDAEAWSAHLTSAPVDGDRVTQEQLDVLRTERIADWLVSEGGTTATTEPDDPIIDHGPMTTMAMPPTTGPVVTDPGSFDVDFADHEDPAAALVVTTDVRQIEVAPGEDFTIEVTIANRTGEALELDGCPFASATWEVVDRSGDPQRSRGSATGCLEDTMTWADGASQTKTFDFTAPDHSSPGPFAAIIEFSNPRVTVTVPGMVTR